MKLIIWKGMYCGNTNNISDALSTHSAGIQIVGGWWRQTRGAPWAVSLLPTTNKTNFA